MDFEKIINIVRGILAMLIPQFKKPDSTEGIKELKEALLGVNELTLFIISRLQDGFQADDVLALFQKLISDEDPELKLAVTKAIEGYDKMPAEVRDIDVGEGLELLDAQVALVNKYLAVFAASKNPEATPQA